MLVVGVGALDDPKNKHYNLNLITVAKNSVKIFEGGRGGTFYKKFPLARIPIKI